MVVAPIGICEAEGLCLSFGPAYRPQPPAGLSADEQDRAVSRILMQHIARLLPSHLRGEFG